MLNSKGSTARLLRGNPKRFRSKPVPVDSKTVGEIDSASVEGTDITSRLLFCIGTSSRVSLVIAATFHTQSTVAVRCNVARDAQVLWSSVNIRNCNLGEREWIRAGNESASGEKPVYLPVYVRVCQLFIAR